MQVQATIQFITDFHRQGHHAGGTAELLALTPARRQAFLTACMEKLHGGRLAEFIEMQQSSLFRPILDIPGGEQHPQPQVIHDAIVAALGLYNAQEFGLTFDDKLGHEATSAAFPPPDCVQWYWQNGVKVYRYNWDGLVIGNELPREGPLVASYRLSLTYT